jgi:hypothetical protein
VHRSGPSREPQAPRAHHRVTRQHCHHHHRHRHWFARVLLQVCAPAGPRAVRVQPRTGARQVLRRKSSADSLVPVSPHRQVNLLVALFHALLFSMIGLKSE